MVQKPMEVAEVYVTDTTPEELVAPAAGAIAPQVPVPTKPTTSPDTGPVDGLVTVAVMVDVVVPLSTTELGEAVTATELLVIGEVVITATAACVPLCVSVAPIETVPPVVPAV
jgi:hypothetical protein